MGNFQDLATTFRELLRMTPDQMTKTSAPDFLKTAAVNAQNDIRFGGERGAPPNSTVAENVLRTAMGNNQPPPQMPPQGVPGMDAAPQMPPQGAQAGGYIHDFGVASLPYTPKYEHGGIVSFGGTTDGSFVAGRNYAPRLYGVEAIDPRQNPESWLYGTDVFVNPDVSFGDEIWPFNEERKLEHLGAKLVGGKSKKALSPTELKTALQSNGRMPPLSRTDINPSANLLPTRDANGKLVYPNSSATSDKLKLTDEEIKNLQGSGFDPSKYLSAGSGMSNLPAIPNYDKFIEDKFIAPKDYDKTKRAAERAEFMKDFGVNPKFYEEQKVENEKNIANLKSQKKKDLWLALVQGGLKMAQTPGSIGQALAAGAESGLGALKETNKEYKEEERVLKQEQKQLAMAEYAANRGDAENEMKYKDKAEEDKRSFLNSKTQALLENKMKRFEIENGRAMKMAEMAQARDLARAEIGSNFALAEMKLKGAIDGNQTDLMKEIIKANATGMPTADTYGKIFAKQLELLSDDMSLSNVIGRDISTLPADQKDQLRKNAAKTATMETFKAANQIWQLQRGQLTAANSGILSGANSGYKVEKEEE